MDEILLNIELPGVRLFKKGKVRDIFDLDDKLLIVATDRLSAFDCILPDGIPGKGKILTALSAFWFNFTSGMIPNHMIATDVDSFPAELRKYSHILEGRSMLVTKTELIEIECVVRGYLSGSAWKEYKTSGEVCGIKLPANLSESDMLPEPIFTPAIKARSGHDENISEKKMVDLVGEGVARAIKEKTLAIYNQASDYAKTKGIIIADTKFEFGKLKNDIVIIDEMLTPDSSRFWPLEGYTPGRPQPSFDKQYVRDYLERITWDKNPPAPRLPGDVIRKTAFKYFEAFRLLTGREAL